MIYSKMGNYILPEMLLKKLRQFSKQFGNAKPLKKQVAE